MRKTMIIVVMLTVALTAAAAWAGQWDATVKLGGIVLDEEGDKSAVQETYNIHDGFNLSEIHLTGSLNPQHYFTLSLREVNLDARQGDLVYRMPGMVRFNAHFDQHRQVFDPARAVTSDRKDWRFGATVTPLKWLDFNAGLNYQTREGDRLSYPAGTVSNLGSKYDYALVTGNVGAEARYGKRGLAVNYRFTDYSDELSEVTDRQGQVVSARVHMPCFFYDKWTHMLRGSLGKRELKNGDLDYELSTFAYTGVIRPIHAFQFRYNFDAERVDDKSTELKTDRIENNFDLTYFNRVGRIYGGYGYETNDDDKTLTSYNSWRAGIALRPDKHFMLKAHYAGRVKEDKEDLTLLRDVEAHRFRGDVEVRPIDWISVGGGYSIRKRDYPDIDVSADGQMARAYGRLDYADWGSVTGEYTYSLDDYDDLAAGFEAESNIYTTRLDFDRIQDLNLAGGLTYVEVRRDLDIQKYFFFLEGMYTVLDDYHLEVKYNRYEYDDFILLDRYYTANVVWINVAYDLHFE